MNKTCIIICGPTASGKTALSLQLARHFNTEIISADSRQCFRELNIGVAKPSEEELREIPHHFINSHSITDELNVAGFEVHALKATESIFKEKDVAVMVGGTGLYIRAFCQGIDAIPAVPDVLRNEIINQYEQFGTEWLRQQIQEHDINFYTRGEITNPQRLMRALEVKLHTGRSIISFQLQAKKERAFRIIKIGLNLPREILYERINNRVDTMIESGLEKEVFQLQEFKHLNALRTVGYTEFFNYFEQREKSIAQPELLKHTIDLIKQNTRNYAKRQITWFKKEKDIKWIDAVKDPWASLVSEISLAK